MSEPRRCPQCDAEIPANSPIGLCPRCLLKAGTDSQSVAASAALGPTVLTPPASGFMPPKVEELAPLFPQLEILELLGKGGMGAVYKARQTSLDRLVAVKILPTEISHDPAFAERFQREARALARLSHPHIVAVYDFGQTLECGVSAPLWMAGTVRGDVATGKSKDAGASKIQSGADTPHSQRLCYIVMEFVDGANLRQAIQTKTLTSAEALAIVPQICEALQFAHDEGIVHRDIKPENILIDKRGRVKIADFGLAKLLGQDASDHSLTATHQVMGTLRYMAPEQMQGSREVDHRADIYSLGVVFYELLTGELPMGRFAPPSKRVQVDVRLDEIVLRALEQRPEQRYQHASEVKTDVDAIVRGKPMMSAATNRVAQPSFEPVMGTAESHSKNTMTESRLVQSPADCLLLAAGIALVTAIGVAAWLLAVPAHSSNQFTNSLVRGNLFGISATLAVYSVLVGIAGLMMRRLQARLFVLLVNVIVGLFLPAVIALNVVMELRSIPVWPAAIPFWIGMPAALWVVVTLFRDDVRGAFNVAAEQRRLSGFSKPSQQLPEVARFAMTPNPSYAKRVGIPVALLFGLGAISMLYAPAVYGQKDNYEEQRFLFILMSWATLFWVTTIILHILFFARRRASMESAATPSDDSGRATRPSYGKRVGIPMTILFGLFAMATNTAQLVYGLEDNNYPGHPKILIIANGAILFWLGVIILHVAFFARRAVPAGFWATVTPFLEEVRRSFVVAAETRRRVAHENALQSASRLDRGPRFSRFAIAGAVWAIFGLLTVIPVLYFIGLNRVWNGTALPTDIIYEAPPLAFTIFMGALLVIGAGAPIGTTIYGGIAIGHIKRSGGKIIGLPLAVSDVLFFPLLVLGGVIAFLVAQVVFAIAPHPNAVAVTSAGAFGVLVALVVCFFVARAAWRAIHPTGALAVRERSAGAWSVLEIVTAVAVAMTFVLAAVKGIYELAQRPCPMDVVAVPVAALAALAAGVLLVVHQIHRPSGSRTALPELFIAVLAACAGSLSWTAVFSPIAGWNFWQGAVFASLNFVLSLFLLIVGKSRLLTRATATLLVGLIGFALVMWFNVGPVGVIGGSEFLTTITRKPGLPGMFIAAALGLLAMIAGALQLRNRMNAADDSVASPPGASTKP